MIYPNNLEDFPPEIDAMDALAKANIKTFGQNVQRARVALGLSVPDLARKTLLAHHHLDMIEKGWFPQLNLIWISYLAFSLQVPLARLFEEPR